MARWSLTLLVGLTLQLAIVHAKVEVSATPSVLMASGDRVTVNWSGLHDLQHPGHLVVAYYSPANSHDSDYVGYFDVPHGDAGSLSFAAVNMRADLEFRLVDLGSEAKPIESIATSNVLTFASANEPTGAHLALTDDPSEMRVIWTTAESVDGSMVQWGEQSGVYPSSAVATFATFKIEDLCGYPANASRGWREPGVKNDAVMSSLQPGRRYFYRVGSDSAGFSTERSFVSHPGVGADVETSAFVFGDMGLDADYLTFLRLQKASTKTVQYMIRDIKDSGDVPWFLAHIGDISYARGYAFLWDQFFYQVEPLASTVPYMVCIGNHEWDWPGHGFQPEWYKYGTDSGGECGVPYDTNFNMPGQGANRNMWYSVDYGAIHFVFFSTEHNFTVGSEQYNWLANDLASVNRSLTPWVVVSGHRPMYTSSNDSGIGENIRQELEPLLNKAPHVDLALWGHVHDYERFCGMTNYTCAASDRDATVHAVVGMGGNDYQIPWAGPGYVHTQQDWVVFRSMTYGYTKLFANATSLRMDYVGDGRGEVHDSLLLTK
mmetsp:Transcript_26085/g.60171  ORF Transcript_26085/g.60171 Transcript_26085/m.60171 type:complete len:546 (+) Transcript_26085:16-1653(+)